MIAAAESVLVPADVALKLMLPTRVLRLPQCWMALVPAWEDGAGPSAGAEVGDGTVPLADGSVPPGRTMPEGIPGDVNAPFPPAPPVVNPPGGVNAAEVLAVSTELARQRFSECANRLASVN